MRFENKKVVIAGGCSDMGIACAKKLLAQGAKVVLVDISDALLAKADGLKAEYLERGIIGGNHRSDGIRGGTDGWHQCSDQLCRYRRKRKCRRYGSIVLEAGN